MLQATLIRIISLAVMTICFATSLFAQMQSAARIVFNRASALQISKDPTQLELAASILKTKKFDPNDTAQIAALERLFNDNSTSEQEARLLAALQAGSQGNPSKESRRARKTDVVVKQQIYATIGRRVRADQRQIDEAVQAVDTKGYTDFLGADHDTCVKHFSLPESVGAVLIAAAESAKQTGLNDISDQAARQIHEAFYSDEDYNWFVSNRLCMGLGAPQGSKCNVFRFRQCGGYGAMSLPPSNLTNELIEIQINPNSNILEKQLAKSLATGKAFAGREALKQFPAVFRSKYTNKCEIYLQRDVTKVESNKREVWFGAVQKSRDEILATNSVLIWLAPREFMKAYRAVPHWRKGPPPPTPEEKKRLDESKCKCQGEICISNDGVASFSFTCNDVGFTVSTKGEFSLTAGKGPASAKITLKGPEEDRNSEPK